MSAIPSKKAFRKISARYEKNGCHYCGKQPTIYTVSTVGKAWRAVCEEHVPKLHVIYGAGAWLPHEPSGSALLALERAKRVGAIPEYATVNTKPGAPWVAGDKDWFKQHPGRTHRIRDAFPGEFDMEPLPSHVALKSLVRQTEPGCRVRVPLGQLLPAPVADDEMSDDAIHQLFEMVSNPSSQDDVLQWCDAAKGSH